MSCRRVTRKFCIHLCCLNHNILLKKTIVENVIAKILSTCPLSEGTIKLLKELTVPVSVPRKTVMIEAGKTNGYAYFIEQGITRSFWRIGGEEFTTSFSTSGDIVFSMDELYYGKESEEFVETIEQSSCFRIAIADLRHLFENNLELCNWGRIIHQNEYRRIHRSHRDRLALSAMERLEAFEKQFPYISNSVNLGYIASYLGMTQPTLSRLRSAKCRK